MKNLFRYEKKFIINNLTIPEIENLLRISNFNFKRNFYNRKVNSIYFDDYNVKSVLENLDGNNFKTKIRLRWYGDEKLINSPILEFKKKNGHLNYKKIFKLKNFNPIKFSKKNISLVLNELIKNFEFLTNKIAISSTHYKRLYFISSKEKIRATLDTDINYFNVQNNSNFHLNKHSKSMILEFKYPNEKDNYVRESLKKISFRVSKNSKYVNSLIEYPYKII